MDLMQAVQNIRQHLEAVKADVETKLAEELPQVERWALAGSQNPAIAVLADAVHLPQAPEVLAELASFIGVVENALGAAKAAAAAQAPAEPPAEQPVAA